MKIEFITKEVHTQLCNYFESNPNLVYQNMGYDYPDKLLWKDDDWQAYNSVTKILQQHIQGFRSFTNFRVSKDGTKVIRIQYDYGDSFTGVGYIKVDELLNGFSN